MVARYAALLCAVVLGCGGDDGAAPSDGGTDAPVDAAADPTEAVFPRDRVIDVSITMAPADWETLRNQQPGTPDASCADPTATGPYDYFPATITIDGTTVARVGVRK